jgi:hypothetical protein
MRGQQNEIDEKKNARKKRWWRRRVAVKKPSRVGRNIKSPDLVKSYHYHFIPKYLFLTY